MTAILPCDPPEIRLPRERRVMHGDFYEVVDGVPVENAPMGAPECRLANRLKRFVDLYDPEEQRGASEIEVRFVLRGEPRLERQPDFAFVSFERWPLDRPMEPGASWNVVPDWVAEIISPTNTLRDVVARVHEYFAAGVRLVWVVFPNVREVYIYTSPSSIRVVGMEHELDGAPVLPDFRLPMRSLFAFEVLPERRDGNGASMRDAPAS